jgi:hypothetical protein
MRTQVREQFQHARPWWRHTRLLQKDGPHLFACSEFLKRKQALPKTNGFHGRIMGGSTLGYSTYRPVTFPHTTLSGD